MGNRPKNYAFRPFGSEWQFTAIYDVHGVGAHSSLEGNPGLAETRHRTPPPLKIYIAAAAAGRSHSPSMIRWREGIARTRRGDLLRGLGSLEICLDAIPGIPSVGFSWRARS